MLVAFSDYFEAVAAALKLISEGADELSVRVEYEDGGMILLVLAAFMDDVKVLVAIDRHVVRRLPIIFVRQLCPIVEDLVTMFAGTDDELLLRFLGGDDARRGQRGSGSGSQEMTTRDGCSRKHKIRWERKRA